MRLGIDDIEHALEIFKHDDVMDDAEFNLFTCAGYVLSNPNWYVLAPDKNSAIVFEPLNLITFSMHPNILPESRDRSTKLCLKAIEYMKSKTKMKKVVSFIPLYHTPMQHLAIALGMYHEGTLKNSWQKGGVVYDILVYGKEV